MKPIFVDCYFLKIGLNRLMVTTFGGITCMINIFKLLLIIRYGLNSLLANISTTEINKD